CSSAGLVCSCRPATTLDSQDESLTSPLRNKAEMADHGRAREFLDDGEATAEKLPDSMRLEVAEDFAGLKQRLDRKRESSPVACTTNALDSVPASDG
ncbi:hypothetical protein, partial [Citreimonas salinaria]|uniref:hypothetical protein n=1 Tax=Citreimonas salinaria TaxID=321339 RepID=UPI001C42EF13